MQRGVNMIIDIDREMLQFLDHFRVANSRQLERFYKDKATCLRRLKKLYDDGVLQRIRDFDTMGYLYSTRAFPTRGRLQQIRHYNMRTSFYFHLLDLGAEVEFVECEKQMAEITADAIMSVLYNGCRYYIYLECETGSKRANLAKYDNVYYSHEWKTHFKREPIVVWHMDQKIIKKLNYPFIRVDSKFEGLEQLWESNKVKALEGYPPMQPLKLYDRKVK